MAPYLDMTGDDRHAALAVYEWSGHMAAAAFEDVGHLEVLLRNTLDRCLRDHYREDTSGIPWFLFFRDVERIAFHHDGEVKAAVPAIVHRRDQVEWTPGAAARLSASLDGDDRRIAEVIRASRARGWHEGRYQVFLLTRDGDSRHRDLSADLPDERAGDGAAFTRVQRYTSLRFLQAAETTADL